MICDKLLELLLLEHTRVLTDADESGDGIGTLLCGFALNLSQFRRSSRLD